MQQCSKTTAHPSQAEQLMWVCFALLARGVSLYATPSYSTNDTPFLSPPPSLRLGQCLETENKSSAAGPTGCQPEPLAAVMAAPLAHFDEDWQDFNEFKPSSASDERLDQLNSNVVADSGLDDFSDLDNSFSGEICSFKSMEDLVHDFDEKLTVCFRNYNTTTENIAPIKPITEDNYLKDDE